MKVFSLIVRFSFLALLCSTCISLPLSGQDRASPQQSVQTLGFTLPPENPPLSEEELDQITVELARKVEQWNEFAKKNSDAGGLVGFIKETQGKAFDFSGEILNVALVASEFTPDHVPNLPKKYLQQAAGVHQLLDEKVFKDRAKENARKRDFKVRETFEKTSTAIVQDYCSGDEMCADAVFNAVLNDPDVQLQIDEADALGAFDEARTRAYVKASLGKSLENYQGTVIEIENMESTVFTAVSEVKNTLIENFEEVKNEQRHIIRNTASIMHIQQEHTIALENLKYTLNQNFQNIESKVDNLSVLQQQNLFLSETILEGVVEIDTRITALSKSFVEMRKEQQIEKIQELFQNSPIHIKIKELEDESSTINQHLSEEERSALLNDLKVIKKKQDIVNTCNVIGQLGKVGQEALSVFCQDRECPQEVSRGIEIGMALTDIVGNITTGNWAQASMSALGILKKPEPSPELKMLNQISNQLEGLEANMNEGFQNMHEHLFALEENLGNRLDIIDFKMDQLAREIAQTRLEILRSLNRVDAKLDYITNQNECIKDLILEVTLEQNQDLCKEPVEAFNNRLAAGKIKDFQDLNNFFQGGSCRSCVDALFKVSGHPNSSFFRYTQCNNDGETINSSPDKIYDYIYNHLLGEERNNPQLIQSLLYIPKNIRVADTLSQFLTLREDGPTLNLGEQDKHYRNYQAVLDYAHYLLTMFSFMEMYDNKGGLVNPEEIRQNPGFSIERTQFMITQLKGTVDLINHTIFQQSLMAGNGVFSAIDQILEGGVDSFNEDEVFTLRDVFSYNSYFRNNYATYFLDRQIGMEMLNHLLEKDVLKKGTSRIVMEGFNILISGEDDQPNFSVSLTNMEEPDRHIKLFSGYLPVADGAIDEDMYERNTDYVYPSAITELLEMKNMVLSRLAEMQLIASSELDEQGNGLSRENLNQFVIRFRE